MTLTKVMTAALIASTLTLSMTPAHAMRRGGDNAVSEQRNKLKAEWRRARAVGGYANPFSAIASLFASDEEQAAIPREKVVAPAVNAKPWVLAD